MYKLVSEKPTRGMLVKSSLYGVVSEKLMIGMLYPFSAGTLTCVKSIVTMCECACATVHRIRMICISGSFLFFWQGRVG
jgi:hypothetical protein